MSAELAFLLGMASHQTADVSWHALGGLDDGFMNAIADLGSWSGLLDDFSNFAFCKFVVLSFQLTL